MMVFLCGCSAGVLDNVDFGFPMAHVVIPTIPLFVDVDMF